MIKTEKFFKLQKVKSKGIRSRKVDWDKVEKIVLQSDPFTRAELKEIAKRCSLRNEPIHVSDPEIIRFLDKLRKYYNVEVRTDGRRFYYYVR